LLASTELLALQLLLFTHVCMRPLQS